MTEQALARPATTASREPLADAERPSRHGHWWRDAVIYQVYVRSFADANGDGTGDLAGVRARLPYLRDLGVDAMWFTPWYASPMADGGYDVADYRAIDPAFGTLDEAEALIGEALEFGIRTIIDIVPNHVSDQHQWFQAALAAGPGLAGAGAVLVPPGPRSGRRRDADELGVELPGPTWTRTTNPDGSPGEWYLHLFSPHQPDLNWNHPDVRREHEEILRFWFDRGVAGVRIDSAALLVKDPALPEVPDDARPGEHPTDGPRRAPRHLSELAGRRRLYPGSRILVGEIWLPDMDRFARYLRPDELHTAFNFDFLGRPWDAASLRASIDTTIAAHAPVGRRATWVLSNHDVTRPVTRSVARTRRSPSRRSGTARRPISSWACAGPGPRLSCRLPCPGRSTSTRATSWASMRSTTCRSTASRTRCTSGRAGSIPGGTAAGSRCRGPAASHRSGSAPKALVPNHGCRNLRAGRTSRSKPRIATTARCSTCIAWHSGSAARSRASATGR